LDSVVAAVAVAAESGLRRLVDCTCWMMIQSNSFVMDEWLWIAAVPGGAFAVVVVVVAAVVVVVVVVVVVIDTKTGCCCCRMTPDRVN